MQTKSSLTMQSIPGRLALLALGMLALSPARAADYDHSRYISPDELRPGMKGYGRIEPGAVANVVVWSGDPLETSTHVEHVFVRGREEPLETRQTLLLRRYRTLPVVRDGAR